MGDIDRQSGPSRDIRASDAEREAVVEQLRVASTEGRLTLGELTERAEAAYRATTRAELAVITSDLPVTAGSFPAARVATEDRERIVAVFGEAKRRGRWRVERPLSAYAVLGDVILDLRGAEVPSGDVDITAVAVMGDVKIYVPDGVDVELTGIAVFGDKSVKVREAAPGQDAPRVVVNATAVMGDVKILGDSYVAPLRRSLGRALRAWFKRDDDRRAISR